MRSQFPQPGAMSEVERLAERAAREGRFGIDTEFMPEGRYRPLLCLVQVCVGGEIAVLDPFEGFDPAPFAEVLADPGVQVVLHAGRQDVAIMRREWRCEVTNVFDTQVAAGFAGFAAQAGYTGLLHDVLKIRVAKTASFTRWDARPLTQEQLSYAQRGRRAPAAAGRRDPEAPALARAASNGRARSAARSPPRATSATRRRSGAGCRAPAGWTRASARSRASWAPGASARRCARTARSARSSATRRWSSSPSASRRAGASWARSAGSTRRWCAAAAPTCWRRSSAASAGAADPARGGRAPADGVRGRTGDRALGGAGARAGAGGRAWPTS